MVRALRFVLCIFLTSSFNSAWADFCFDNTNQKGIMPAKICFKAISVLSPGTANQKIYLKNSDVDDVYAIKKIEAVKNGFLVSVAGDYINYAEDCGLTIMSSFAFRFFVNSNYLYQHVKTNDLRISYQYTPNSCRFKAQDGNEVFTVSSPLN